MLSSTGTPQNLWSILQKPLEPPQILYVQFLDATCKQIYAPRCRWANRVAYAGLYINHSRL